MILSIHAICSIANFGDKRINLRFEKILGILSIRIEHSIPLTFKKWFRTKAVYRFLNNGKVTDKAIIESQLTLAESGSTYLAIHDTTEADFTGHRSAVNLGCLQYENKKGLFIHNTLLCDENGIPESVFYQHFWSRDAKTLSKKKARKYLPIQKKESHRWIEGVERVNNYFAQFIDSRVVNICDREGDIYELFSMNVCSNSDFLIRSCNNRLTKEEDKVWDLVKSQAVKFKYDIEIYDRQNLKKRIAHLEVKWLSDIPLKPPYRKDKILPDVNVNILYIQEVNAPKGVKPIDWRLLTSLDITTNEDANKIITTYGYRWRIETFHYILKQGCNIESLQLQEEQSLKNAISLYSIMACRILAMMYLSRENPDLPIEEIGFTKDQFTILHTFLEENYEFKFNAQSKKPTVGNFTALIGMLGGHFKHNSQYPGIKILWRGMKEFNTILSCFEILSRERCG